MAFDGDFYSVDEFRLEPNQGQSPRILAGGGGVETDDGRRVRNSVKRRLRYADGWIAPPRSPSTLAQDWEEFGDYLESNGRDPGAYDKVALQYLHLVLDEDSERAHRIQRNVYSSMIGSDRSVSHATENWLTGSLDDVRTTLEKYKQQGFDEVILHPVTHNPAELERHLRLIKTELRPAYR